MRDTDQLIRIARIEQGFDISDLGNGIRQAIPYVVISILFGTACVAGGLYGILRTEP